MREKALYMREKARIMMKENIRSIWISFFCIIAGLIILLVPYSQKSSEPVNLSEYYSVGTIGELATLRSYYHNVAIYEEQPDATVKVISDILTWPFNTLLKTGYKQFWLEYSGIIETGIDTDAIQIGDPNAEGIIDIYIPDARILNIDADEDSFSEPLDERGLFTTITGKERTNAYAAAQEAMKQEAANDQALLKRAKANAKLLIERYFINIGKELGVNYSINWLESPK